MPSQIELAIDDALDDVRKDITLAIKTKVVDYAKKILAEKAEDEVYSYNASEFFSGTRRKYNGGLQDPSNMKENVISSNDLIKLIIESEVPLQNLFYSDDAEDIDDSNLVDIVESGASNYNQPKPRPYHEIAELELATNGEVESIIRSFIR